MKRTNILITILLLMMVVVWSSPGSATLAAQDTAEEGNKIKVKSGSQVLFVFREISAGDEWKATSENLELKITRMGEEHLFKLGSDVYKLKKDANKYKLTKPDGSFYLKFKLKTDGSKIKIYSKETEPAPWSLKKKDEGIKWNIKKGDLKLGKIKFYADKGKIKVKDKVDFEICSAKSDKLVLGPAVAMFKELDEKGKLFAFAVLSIIAK